MTRPACLFAVAALALASVSLGCKKQTTLNDVLYPDVTPELGNTATSDAQTRYKETIVVDHNLRALRDDVSRFMLFDQPSRLTPRSLP